MPGKKSRSLTTSLNDSNLEFVEYQCKKLDISPSEYLRGLVLTHIEKHDKRPKLDMPKPWINLLGFWCCSYPKVNLLIIEYNRTLFLIELGRSWEDTRLIYSTKKLTEMKHFAENYRKEYLCYEAVLPNRNATAKQRSIFQLPLDLPINSEEISMLISLSYNFRRIINLCLSATQP